jgi:hypothetical protein
MLNKFLQYFHGMNVTPPAPHTHNYCQQEYMCVYVCVCVFYEKLGCLENK